MTPASDHVTVGPREDDDEEDVVWIDGSGHEEHEHSAEGASEEEPPLLELVDNPCVPSGAEEVQLETGVVLDQPADGREWEDLDGEDEEEGGTLLRADFNATCRLAARLGAAAMHNGSIAENIERFLPKLMSVYGYYGFFSCSTVELSCNFEKQVSDHEDTVVRTQNVAINAGGFQLTKLGLLSDLAKDLMAHNIDIKEANKLLDVIEAAPDPWGVWSLAVAFVGIGTSLPALLSGTWWDMLVGPFAGAMAYGLILLFDAWPSRLHIWLNLISAFLCSVLGCAVQLVRPEVDPLIVTLSGIGFILPSSTITLGINDLVTNHVISGFERLVKGLIGMMWLAVGYILGVLFVNSLVDKLGWEITLVPTEVEPIPALWQLLFVPILCSSISMCFQMTGKDWMGANFGMLVGYGTSYCALQFFHESSYIGSFIGSVAISLYANVWSRYNDRPNTIILFPAFQLVVAGIVGYMGLTKLIQGSPEESTQVLHMLGIAGIVVVGFLVGGTMVQPTTII